ncbi:putative sugar ABC transporter maltose-binding protein CymE [Escherichia coli]|uniref:Putative sugar ABC transporter maltose-binding protein CymE n=1 Tax=Escherichia coli TaxID=562 RepID=A0A376TG16_ECOLX|nr:putative sugar ABC transporter maltose-binding protein CymE [Escherichia coli]
MKLSNIVTVIILAISSTLTPQAMAEKLIPETDAELLVLV